MAEAFEDHPERLFSLEQERLIAAARQLLNESPRTQHDGPWREAWEQWRPTTIREKWAIVLGWMSIRPLPSELEQAALLFTPKRMEDNYEVIVRGNGWDGPTVRLKRQVLTRIGEHDSDQERLSVYGTEGYRLDPVWEQNLLEPINDLQVVAVLQYELDAAMERAQQERLVEV